MSFDQLLTTKEVAALLGVSPRQVARFVQRGNLAPAVQGPGARGALFFDLSEVKRFQGASL